MVEHALGQLQANRFALSRLTERIDGDETDLDWQTGPGMRREIMIAGGLRFLEVQTGQRGLDFDRLVGLAAVAANDSFDTFDAIIVACPVVDPQRRARGRLGWFCEGNFRRIVGDY